MMETKASPAYVYSDKVLKYNFGASHPFRPERWAYAAKAAEASGLFSKATLLEPQKATPEELELFHEKDYVEALISNNEEKLLYYGIGAGDNPFFDGVGEASLIVAGATLTALSSLMKGAPVSFAFSGGLHHAHSRYASGFCLINDAAIAIRKYLSETKYERPASVVYLDIDAHHGDGVSYGFYHDHRVLAISIHESGRYLFPGTGHANERGKGEGEGFNLNIPLPPGSGESVFLTALNEIIMPALYAAKPDLLVIQSGTDGYKQDPLTHLNYSPYCYKAFVDSIKRFSEQNQETKLLFVGGGGYVPWFAAAVWTFIALSLSGIQVQGGIPSGVLKEIPGAPDEFSMEESFETGTPHALKEEWETTLAASLDNVRFLSKKIGIS